jgi:hypothetical protein
MRVVGLVAEGQERDGILGSIQFVRHRREPGTWMFGHWRVSSPQRRAGVGRLLVCEGLRRLPEIRRLYSFVEWNNEASIAAHNRLAFEAAPELWGRAALGPLSTLGPPPPAMRLDRVRTRGSEFVRSLFLRSMGPLWSGLFPGLSSRGDPGPACAPWDLRGRLTLLWRKMSTRAWSAGASDGPKALLVRTGRDATLYLDPAECDPGLLARVALAMLSIGFERGQEVELRGLSRGLVERGGPIRAQILMGLTEVGSLRREAN